jgi:hypothetical protein
MTEQLACLDLLDRALAAVRAGQTRLAIDLLEQLRVEVADEIKITREDAFREGKLEGLIQGSAAVATDESLL